MKGLVTKLIGGLYTVKDSLSGEYFTCEARGKLRQIKLDKNNSFLKSTSDRTKVEAHNIKLSPKVGDVVTFEKNAGVNYIMDIDPRFNDLVRPDVANIDQAILIFAAKEPEFSWILLDRFLAIIEFSNVNPVIIVSKMDLLSKEEANDMKEKLSYYEKMYKVYFVSSKLNLGVDQIKTIFKDKISVFTGQTGVGKSSLLNVLDPRFHLNTQEISQALGRGKHTTRHTELYEFGGGMVADTPGFGSIDYGNMTVYDLMRSFRDFYELSNQCKFRECMHIQEPSCHIRELYEKNLLLKSRYENYLKFYDEVKQRKKRY